MYAKNLLGKIQSLIDLDKDYKIVIDIFYEEYNSELTMIYFLKKTKINKDKLYDIFHELVKRDVIGFNEYTRCPNCMSMQRVNSKSDLSLCKRCRIKYFNDYNIEKFYLKDFTYEEKDY